MLYIFLPKILKKTTNACFSLMYLTSQLDKYLLNCCQVPGTFLGHHEQPQEVIRHLRGQLVVWLN